MCKTEEQIRAWLEDISNGGVPLSPLQMFECKQAYKLIEEKGGGKSLLECLKVGLNTDEPEDSIKLGEAVDEYLKSKVGSISEITYKDYRLYLLQLQSHLGDDTLLLSVGRVQIAGYLKQYSSRPHSYNHAFRSISAFITWCMKCEYITANPIHALSKLQAETKDIGFLSTEEAKKLLQQALTTRPDFIPYITLGLFAGLRPWEAMRVHESDFNLKTCYIRLGASKTKSKKGAGRMVPIRPALLIWLTLFPVKGDVMPLKPVTVNLVLRTLAKSAKVTLPRNALRHSFATHAHAADANPDATAQAMGHSVAIAKAHYVGLVTQKEGKEYFEITPLNVTTITKKPGEKQRPLMEFIKSDSTRPDNGTRIVSTSRPSPRP